MTKPFMVNEFILGEENVYHLYHVTDDASSARSNVNYYNTVCGKLPCPTARTLVEVSASEIRVLAENEGVCLECLAKEGLSHLVPSSKMDNIIDTTE